MTSKQNVKSISNISRHFAFLIFLRKNVVIISLLLHLLFALLSKLIDPVINVLAFMLLAEMF